MQIRYNNQNETRVYVTNILRNRVRIGSSTDNDIVLSSPFADRDGAELKRDTDGWQLRVLGRNGCEYNGRRLAIDSTVRIPDDAAFTLFPFEFTLDPTDTEDLSRDDLWRELEQRSTELVRDIHVRLLEQMDLATTDITTATPEFFLTVERNIEVIAGQCGVTDAECQDVLLHLAGHCVRSHLLDRVLEQSAVASSSLMQHRTRWSRLQSGVPDRERELVRTAHGIAAAIGIDSELPVTETIRRIDRGIRHAWHDAAQDLLPDTLLYLSLRHLKKQVKDILFGYGPLEDLLRLPTISEVMVVGSDRIYVETDGLLQNSGRRFVSDKVTLAIIERIVSRVGRRIDKSQPLVNARLSDGSRVNAVIDPIALDGPLLTIRKFPLQRLTVEELVRRGAMTETVARFLEASVIARRNILISGGTGTGKTTLLNCLADFIPDNERILTVEDTAELQLAKQHVGRMETKDANIEGAGEYTIADLVRNALRMRPDRIVVGECRGAEALSMLQAMNTGHDGSLTTIHANSAQEVVERLEVMVQSAVDLPVESTHRQITAAIDLIVQLKRHTDGRRTVCQVAEVLPTGRQGDRVRMKDLYLESDDEGLMPTGRIPTFMNDLLRRNLLDLDAFYL